MSNKELVIILIIAILLVMLAVSAGVGTAHVVKDFNGRNNDTAACHLFGNCD